MLQIAFSRLLAIVVAIALIGVAAYAGALSFESWRRHHDLTRASSLSRLAIAVGRFGGIAIPGEGAATREFLAGTVDRARMETQRRVTDELYGAVREAAAANLVQDAKVGAQLHALEGRMRTIVGMRRSVDARTRLGPGGSPAVLAPTATLAIDSVGVMSSVVADPVLARQMLGFYATLQFTENAMVQRGPGLAVLRGTAPRSVYLHFHRAVTLNATFRKLVDDYPPAPVVAQFNAFDAMHGTELQRLREQALANPTAAASEADIERWKAIVGEMTPVFHRAVVAAADLVAAEAERRVSEAWRSTLTYLAASLAALLLMLLSSRVIVRGLPGQLRGLTDTMDAGRRDTAVPGLERSDALGEMARAAESLRDDLAGAEAPAAEPKESEAREALQRVAG